MSILGKLGKRLRKAAGGALGFAVAGPAGAAFGTQLMAGAGPRARALGFTAPSQPLFPGATQVSAVKPFIGDRPGLDILGGECPPGWHLDKATRSRCVRNRRMNFANGRAAKRSLRRIRGTMKLLKGIEKEIGKAAPRRLSRRAPAGHAARLRHD